jgi:hypothetical protein
MDTRSRDRSQGPRRRGRLGCGGLLAVSLLSILVVYVGLTPWALHIGGRSTPLEAWDGYGQVQASNGGKYVLFTHLRGGAHDEHGRRSCGPIGGCDTLHGTAQLCTGYGLTHTFKLTGKVKAWLSTDGARTGIDLTGGTPTRLPSGWVVAFHGVWHGPALELESPDNSFTEIFTKRGEIRHVTSTADAGTAKVTLNYGTEAEFAAACRDLWHQLGG